MEYLAASLDGEFPFGELFRCIGSPILPTISLLLERHEKLLADSIEAITRPIDYSKIGSNITGLTIKNYYVYERLFID